MASKTTLKYLSTYAQAESQALDGFEQSYEFVAVIPICAEALDCLEVIFKNIKQDKVLIIVVVNSAADNHKFQLKNQKFISKLLNNAGNNQRLNNNCQLLKFSQFNDVLLVDRNSTGLQIPTEQGVGLARKIGADIAVKLYSMGKIQSPWIFSTDADVQLPVNYFKTYSQEYSAVVLDFEHVSDDKNLQQLQYKYDFKLRYYRAGLCYAQCGYDYIPLGSTVIINMCCYVQVRGFPKRNAGEDFYLLNKLAKVKPIKYRFQNCIVSIRSRFSTRVPFGTGPALMQINELANSADYTYYHPKCFIYLKNWHIFLLSMWQDKQLHIKPPKDEMLQQLYAFLKVELVLQKSKKQITSSERWQQFVEQWFDAFKILKSVHFFDKKFCRLNYLQLLNDTSFAKVNNSELQKIIYHHDKV